MTLVSVVSRRFWRILSPRWRPAPLSGAGAARNGGRWNRPGEPALYMSEAIETAFAEYQQELGVRPGTFIAFEVAGARIAHVADDAELASEDLLGPWKEEAFVRNLDPPTWRLADALRARADGARVPSSRYPGGINLVLWRWNETGGPAVTWLDPNGELGEFR